MQIRLKEEEGDETRKKENEKTIENQKEKKKRG